MQSSPEQRQALNQSSLRDQNLRLVAQTLWRAYGGLTRAELAAHTGLTRATVSRLVTDLISARLVDEAGPTDSGQPGRPGTRLRPAVGTVAAVGLEININHTAGRVIDLAGETLGEFAVTEPQAGSTPDERLEELGKRATSMMRRVQTTYPDLMWAGSSFGVPGLVSAANQIRVAPNLGWREVRPAELMGRDFTRMNTGLFVDNDAALQALTFSRLAPGRLIADPTFLFIAGDVGIGAAIVQNGHVQRGVHGWAGELGHMTIDPHGPKCVCGSRGCLERYTGSWAVQTAAGLEPQFDMSPLLSALHQADPKAEEAIDQAAWALGIAIANALKTLDMRQVILGTSLAKLAPWMLARTQQTLIQNLLWADFEPVVVLSAPPDPYAATTGGAYRLLEQVLDNPAQWIADHQPISVGM